MPSTMLDVPDLRMLSRRRRFMTALATRRHPLVSYLLILANGAVFGLGMYLAVRQGVPLKDFLQHSDDPKVLEVVHQIGALSGADLEAGEWWRLLSLCFAHFGIMHLLMNMVALYVLGRIEEPLWGRWRFLAIYLISGLAGSCALVIAHPQAQALGAGASGAVLGLLTALAVWVVANRRYAGPRRRFRLPVIFLVLALETASSFLPGISAAAHFGGGGMGVVASLLFLGQMYGRPVRRWLCLAAIVALPVLCLCSLLSARVVALSLARREVARQAKEAERIEQRLEELMRFAEPAEEWSEEIAKSSEGPAPAQEFLALLQEARDKFQSAGERMSRAWAFRYPEAERMREAVLEDNRRRIIVEEWMVLSRALDHETDAWRSFRLAEPLLRLSPGARDRATAEDMLVTLEEQQSRFQDRLAFLQGIGLCLDHEAEGIRHLSAAHMEASAQLCKVAAQCLGQAGSWSRSQQVELELQKQRFKQIQYRVRIHLAALPRLSTKRPI